MLAWINNCTPSIFVELIAYTWHNCNASSAILSLQWRHNGRDGVSNRQPYHCLLNRLFRRRSKKTSLAFVQGIHRWPVNSPHKWPVTQKMFLFDDVIMLLMKDATGCIHLSWPTIQTYLDLWMWTLRLRPLHWKQTIADFIAYTVHSIP